MVLTMLTVHYSNLAGDAIKSARSNYYQQNPHAKKPDFGGTGSSMPKIVTETVSAGTSGQQSATA
jgi:hypothetical protein